MGGLHSLLYRCQQLFLQLAQVYLVAEGCAKGRQGSSGVVFAAVEASIDNVLDALAQWLGKCGNDEGGADNRYIVILIDETT